MTARLDNEEQIEQHFESYVEYGYKRSGIIFACILARLLPFSEARFLYQRLRSGRPGDLFGDGGSGSLALLEHPWPNGTTGELLARMEQDASLAGNFYATTAGTGPNRRIRRMRPDWVTIVSGIRGDDESSSYELDAEVLGYIYAPPAMGRRAVAPTLLLPKQVVHYSPIPDPIAQWRGMSWLTPVVREIQADLATIKHKLKFFENGATPGFVVKYDSSISFDAFQKFVTFFTEQQSGVDNAYRVLHLGGGADPTTVGADMRQLDFKATQGAGETRIAAAAGVGAIIARFSEGMQGSALNQGNYGAARRQFGDMTIRPLWRMAAASLEKFSSPPADARLWFDTRDIKFLQEDEKDAAEIRSKDAAVISSLINAGFKPDAAVDFVRNGGDYNRLTGQHTGLYSVQLQPPGTTTTPELPAPNGSADRPPIPTR